MKLDLSEITQHIGMRSVQEIDEPCFPEDAELTCVSPLRGRVDLTNTGTLLLVRGKVGAEVRQQCGRCLSDLTLPVEADIDEQFRLVHIGDSVVAVADDEESELVANNILDLGELIRQNMLVGIPIGPICSPECRGLCPTCGSNLNQGECGCPQEPVESPFQALAGLLEEESPEDS